MKFFSLTVNYGGENGGCHCAQWVKNIGIDRNDAERAFDERGQILQNKREPPADDEGDETVVGDVVQVVFADAVTLGMFFSKVDSDPGGKNQQNHVARRGEEIAKECEHVI